MLAREAARQLFLGLVVVLAAPDIGVDLSPESEQYRERIDAAAKEALIVYEQWLGPLRRQLTVPVVPSNLPWRSPAPLMEVEAHVAYAIALRYWHDSERDETSIAKSLSWFLQSRVVERLFDLRYGVLAHHTDGVRLFGGHVPWPLPSIRLSRWTAGLAGHHAHRTPNGVDAHTIRGAFAFASLERYLGWPVLQGALRVLAQDNVETPLTLQHVQNVISAATGQDLRWFFGTAFDPAVIFDYAVADFATSPAVCTGAPCYRTDVVVVRNGSGQFTGSSRDPVGEFDSGDGIELRIAFVDGQELTTSWDGRAARRTFTFESPALPASVRLDPKGILLLEATPLDHVRATSPRSNMPIGKWVARWLAWLQDAMITASSLL